MRFNTAVTLLRKGFYLKRKKWSKYWSLEKEDILVEHFANGSERTLTTDIQSCPIFSLFECLAARDWEIATVKNCRALHTMTESDNK